MKIIYTIIVLITAASVTLADGFFIYSGVGLGLNTSTVATTANIISHGVEDSEGFGDGEFSDAALMASNLFMDGPGGNASFGVDLKGGYEFEDSEWSLYTSIVFLSLNIDQNIVTTLQAPAGNGDIMFSSVAVGTGYDILDENSQLQITMEFGGAYNYMSTFGFDDDGSDANWHSHFLGTHINPSVSYRFEKSNIRAYLQNNLFIPIMQLSSSGNTDVRIGLRDRIVYMPTIGLLWSFGG
jgi:hypothetical protein